MQAVFASDNLLIGFLLYIVTVCGLALTIVVCCDCEKKKEKKVAYLSLDEVGFRDDNAPEKQKKKKKLKKSAEDEKDKKKEEVKKAPAPKEFAGTRDYATLMSVHQNQMNPSIVKPAESKAKAVETMGYNVFGETQIRAFEQKAATKPETAEKQVDEQIAKPAPPVGGMPIQSQLKPGMKVPAPFPLASRVVHSPASPKVSADKKPFPDNRLIDEVETVDRSPSVTGALSLPRILCSQCGGPGQTMMPNLQEKPKLSPASSKKVANQAATKTGKSVDSAEPRRRKQNFVPNVEYLKRRNKKEILQDNKVLSPISPNQTIQDAKTLERSQDREGLGQFCKRL